MFTIRRTDTFSLWLDQLRDLKARARIQARLDRLADGNAGDVCPVGKGISELRIDYGPGYRVYYKRHGSDVIILLAGGDKGTQAQDIRKAIEMAADLE